MTSFNEAAILSPSPEEFADAPGTEQVTYRVTFERVGRHGGRDGSAPPAPLVARVLGGDGLAERIYDYVGPYLGSSGIEVFLDEEQEMRGFIVCGFHIGGQFTIERLDGEQG